MLIFALHHQTLFKHNLSRPRIFYSGGCRPRTTKVRGRLDSRDSRVLSVLAAALFFQMSDQAGRKHLKIFDQIKPTHPQIHTVNDWQSIGTILPLGGTRDQKWCHTFELRHRWFCQINKGHLMNSSDCIPLHLLVFSRPMRFLKISVQLTLHKLRIKMFMS